MKRIISVVLSTIICFSVLVVGQITASATDKITIKDSQGCWGYICDVVNKKANLVDFVANKDTVLTDLTIPSTITYNDMDYNIESIPISFLSANNPDIENIKIESGIKAVGTKVFSGCTNLKTITIPSTLLSCKCSIGNDFGYGAFSEIPSLEQIIFEDTEQKFIPSGLYAGITAPNFKFEFPETIKEVGDSAFAYSSIDKFELPKAVTTIPTNCYAGCFNIKTLNLPENIETLKTKAFYFNKNLETINLNTKIKEIPSYCFAGSNITSITIPNNVSSIGSYAFSGCSKLTTINYSNKVSVIPNYCFQNCASLTEVTIPSTVKTLNVGAYAGCNSLTKITIPGTVTKIYDIALPYDNPNLVIYGADKSAGSVYAEHYNVKFVSISKNIQLTKECCIMNSTSFTYTGKEIKPSFTVVAGEAIVKDGVIVGGNYMTLRNGVDYYCYYENNINIGSGKLVVVGKGDYSGTVTLNFTIKAKSINNLKFNEGQKRFAYNGRPQFPTVSVYDGEYKLKQGDDYKVTLGASRDVGKCLLRIEGKNNYTGTKRVEYIIVPKKPNKPTARVVKRNEDSLVLYAKASGTYDGLRVYVYDCYKKSYVKLCYFDKNKTNKYTVKGLKQNRTYRLDVTTYIKYEDLKGKKKLYSASRSITMVTKIPATSISKIKVNKRKVITTWKPISATGYVFQYYINPYTTSFKKVVLDKSHTSYTLKNIHKKSYVYLRVRAYKKLNGKIYYGENSKIKRVYVS